MPSSPPIRDCECESLWNPHRLVSLWEIMIEFHCNRIARVIQRLNQLIRSADSDWFDKEAKSPFIDPSLFLQTEMQGILFAVQTNSLEMPHSQREAANILREIEIGLKHSSSDVSRIAGQILDTVKAELDRLKFAYIPPERVQYFEQKALFGEDVLDRFPSLSEDIKDAGNCIAVGLFNPGASQLIRVAEGGLRSFAAFCRVPKTLPYEWRDWGNLSAEINKELTRAPYGLAASFPRRSAIEFGKKCMQEAHLIHKGWRDEDAHNRVVYTEDDVKALCGHVKNFMVLLASRLKEGGRQKRIEKN